MPGRKSNISTITNGEDETPGPSKAPRESMGVEDLSLPRTMIQRLAKGVLPANTSIGKDALLALSKSATVFINYLAANSGEFATSNGKKTIMPHDVYAALKEYDFESFLPRVQAEVTKYNEIQCDKRNSYRRKIKQEKAAAVPANGEGHDESTISAESTDPLAPTNGGAKDDDLERPTKKARREPGDEVDDDEEEDEINADEEVEEDGKDEADEDELEVVEDEEMDEAEVQAEEGGNDEGHVDRSHLGGGIVDEALDEPDSD